MDQSRAVYIILTGLLVILNCTWINAQTANEANLKTRSQLLQNKPQTDIQKVQAEQLIKSLTKDRQKTFKAVSAIMANQLFENLKSNKSEEQKDIDARKIISAGMEKTAVITNAPNAEILIQNTLSAVTYGIQKDLNQFVGQVSTDNHVIEILKEDIVLLKGLLSYWPDNGSVKEVSYRKCVKLSDGSYEVVETIRILTKEKAKNLLEEMENQLAAISDMSEMDNMNLQEAMNKQQQVMQIISNLMKQMHDTAKAIIDNMR